MAIGYTEYSIHRAVVIDVDGVYVPSGVELGLASILDEGYSIAGTPSFPDGEREYNALPGAEGFVRQVPGMVPIQELTFTTNMSNAGLFRAARRPYELLGQTLASAAVNTQPQITFNEVIERVLNTDPAGNRQRRLFQRVYRGRVRSPIPSYQENGVTQYEVTLPDVVYIREAETPWLTPNNQGEYELPANFVEDLNNPSQLFLMDKELGRYITNGYDEFAGLRGLLGLAATR